MRISVSIVIFVCKEEIQDSFVIFDLIFFRVIANTDHCIFFHTDSAIESGIKSERRSDACRKCVILLDVAFKDGITRAFHFAVEFREIASSAWSINGFWNRSVTDAAKLISSSSGRDSVGMILDRSPVSYNHG